MEHLIQLDKQLLVFLNGLGSERFDGLWLIITKQAYWTPIFLYVFYLLYKKLGWKHMLLVIFSLALLIAFTDQMTNLVKNSVQRLRPCNDPETKDIIRLVKQSSSFSYFSGHAANSLASTTFIVLILRKYYKYAFLFFLFPLIFAYSRIYLGLHFPGDILSGYIFGIGTGYLFSKIYEVYRKKYFPDSI